jgi:uncharacterized protein (TIGR02145 family)
MMKKTRLLTVLVLAILFVQCKREPLQTQPKVLNLSDFESHDGMVSLNISGGKTPYVIQWSNNESDSIVSALSAGIYYVTITDSKKNMLVDTIEISQPEWPLCTDNEGNSYKTTIVADQIWMMENLRATLNPQGESIENFVYDNNEEYAEIYGRLYTWNTAINGSTDIESQGICPDGWHLPTNEDWTLLLDNISTVDKEIPNIKKALDLKYAGFYNNGFNNLDASVSFWTSTQSADNAWKVYFNKSLSKAFRYHEKKTNAISVRCVKNN